jgi:hypothetical protein
MNFDLQGLLGWLLNVSEHYPDHFVLLGSSIFGWVVTLAIERYFLPAAADDASRRQQQGLTFLFCWTISSGSSILLWGIVDPRDPLALRIVVSVMAGAMGFFLYPVLARIAETKFPLIASAWDHK